MHKDYINNINRWTRVQDEKLRGDKFYLLTVIYEEKGVLTRYTSIGTYSPTLKSFSVINLKNDRDWVFSWKDLPPPHHRALGGS